MSCGNLFANFSTPMHRGHGQSKANYERGSMVGCASRAQLGKGENDEEQFSELANAGVPSSSAKRRLVGKEFTKT